MAQSFRLAGTVRDVFGAPLVRPVHAHRRSGGASAGATTSDAAGAWELLTADGEDHYLVTLDDVYNAAIYDRVQPLGPRYWRLRFTERQPGQTLVALREVELLAGTVDRTTGRGDYTWLNQSAGPGNSPGNLVDGTTSSSGGWDAVDGWIWGIDLGRPYQVDTLTLQTTGFSNGIEGPRAFVLEWSEDGASNWVPELAVNNITWAASGQVKTWVLGIVTAATVEVSLPLGASVTASISAATAPALLQETGDNLKLEDGSTLLLD